MMTYNSDQIIQQLDECSIQIGYPFPMLDNGYLALADTRLAVFRGDTHWVIVIETLTCNNRLSGHNAIRDDCYYYGNCLTRPPGMHDDYSRCRTRDGPESPTFTFDPFLQYEVSPLAKSLYIRDRLVPISLDPADYLQWGITLQEPPTILNVELLRWLAPQYRDVFFATVEELREGSTETVQPFLSLAEWRHPAVDDEKPSDLETFRMLAEAIATGDVKRYRPQERPNTHWSNWPMGGSL